MFCRRLQMVCEMLKLTPNLHIKFNDQLIDRLQRNGISTIFDFLRTDSNKLNKLLQIELVDLIAMKMEFWKLIGISPINGFQHYELLLYKFNYTPTGIDSLDSLLNGGLIFGNLIDVCGMASAGKTQLHTTIALNWAIDYDYETFVIDTKGDFSGERIHSILANRRTFDAEKSKQIMRNIKVEKCNNSLNQLVELLQNLLQSVHLYPKFKLLVIDSMPTLWFLHHGSKSSLRHRQLAILADLLRKLAIEHGIVVLTVNIETRLIVSDEFILSSVDDSNAARELHRMENDGDDSVNRTMMLPTAKEIHKPAMGKYWKTICSIRLQIQKLKATTATTMAAEAAATAITKNSNERTIRILKSNQHSANGCCTVLITNTGII